MKELLEQRNRVKAKKPKFIRRDAYKKAKLAEKWRRPKGLQNKMRLRKRGYHRHVQIGWGSPAAVRGLDKSGLEPVLVYTLADLEGLDNKTQGVIIASAIGARKKVTIIDTALKADIKILNLDGKKFLEETEASLKKKRETKKQREERKKQTEKDAKKEAEKKEKEEKKAAEEEVSDEEKKKQEKEAQDKILTKK